MNSSFNAFSKVVTKYVLGSQDRFNELKDQLAMCEHATSKAGAAALGYLMAMEEKEDASSIYDKVLEQVENDGGETMERTDAIFLAVYKWLDKIFEDEDYENSGYVRQLLAQKFEVYIP